MTIWSALGGFRMGRRYERFYLTKYLLKDENDHVEIHQLLGSPAAISLARSIKSMPCA